MDQIPYRKVHLGVRVGLAVTVGIVVLMVIVGVTMAAGDNPDEYVGKWLDIGDTDTASYVCSMAKPCDNTWKTFQDKCFFGSKTPAGSRDEAVKKCSALNSKATLAVIDNGEQDAFAFKMCKESRILEKFCIFGLKGKKNGEKKDWYWMGGSTSSYRNWWTTSQHEEPTGGEETTVSWLTTEFKDEVVAGAFIGFIILLVYLLLVISCCTMNSCFVWCGLKNSNKCCLILSASLDGAMSGFMVLSALGALVRGPDWGGLLTNLALFALFLTGSILGCCQCVPAGAAQETAPEVVVGNVQGQLVGQPVEMIGGK